MVALPGFNTHVSKLNVNDKDIIMLFAIIYKPCMVNKYLCFLQLTAQKANICTERLNWGGDGKRGRKKKKKRKKNAAFPPEILTSKYLHMV